MEMGLFLTLYFSSPQAKGHLWAINKHTLFNSCWRGVWTPGELDVS